MLRSMYAGISGMKANQVKLDVIGNNIANVGTTSFKSSRVRFQDMLSQGLTSAMAPSLNKGGINGSTVGLGAEIAGIDSLMKQGNMQTTSRNLDVAIDGEGYFMVTKGPVAWESGKITIDAETSEIAEAADNQLLYTRDGSFTLDSDGNLLTSSGLRVLGYTVADTIDSTEGTVKFVDADTEDLQVDTENLMTLKIPDEVVTDDGNARIISFSIESNGLIKAVLNGGKVSILGQVAMASFKNPAGLEKNGGNLYSESSNSGNAVIRSGYGVAEESDNSSGYGDMLQGMLEMSNVDLSEQFTDMIVATRAFQASGKMISTGDEILQDIINLKR